MRNHARQLRTKAERQAKTIPLPETTGAYRGGLVYFFGTADGTQIKIGHTDDLLEVRKSQLEMGNPFDPTGIQLTTLAAVAGDAGNERSVQTYFKRQGCWIEPVKKRASREMFEPLAPLLGYIAWLRMQSYVAVSCAESTRISPRPYDEWAPQPTRVAPYETVTLLDHLRVWGTLEAPRELTGDDYFTPTHIIEAARSTMGSIDIDPASHVIANTDVVKAAIFFEKTRSGLERLWPGNVWLNPPFGSWPDWAHALAQRIDGGSLLQACVLASTPTINALYFEPVLKRMHAMCVVRGRLEFWGYNVEVGEGAGASSGHVILYYGPNVDRFAAKFSPYGTIYYMERTRCT